MKTKFTALLLSSFFCFSIFLLTGCTDEPSCPNEKEGYRYMPEEYKKILPYSGFDTIKFLTNTNDTMTCVGQGRTTFFEADYVRDPNPDCHVYTKINYEGYRDQFNEFDVFQSYSPVSPYNFWTPSFKIIWRGSEFIFDNLAVGKNVESINYFYDSLVVNNVNYYKVTEFKGKTKDDRIFINKSNGIIKLFNSTSQVTLTLISK